MVRIGIAGIGFMGMVHYLSYQKVRGATVVAIAEPDPQRRAGDWTGIQGNFGPRGEQMDLSGVAAYASLDEMLADESIDLVDLTLPPAAHAPATLAALKAGKAVFCEKPMALAAADAKRMQQAATRAGLPLLIGHVLPFFPEYAWARKVIASGKYGKLLGGAFKRVVSEPTWLKNFWDPDQVGGPMYDLHVHDAHFIRLLFGMPKCVTTTGRERNSLPQFWHSQFAFDSGAVVEATSGTIDQQGRSFQHGFEIHLERATLAFDFAVLGGEGRYLCPPTLIENRGAKPAKLTGGDPMDAFEAELREVVQCVRTGSPSEVLSGELALDAMLLCQRQAESLRSGKTVRVAK